MGNDALELADYASPPVTEVALSVQFNPAKGLNLAHLGEFWGERKEQFPKVRAMQPLSGVNEVFGDQQHWLPPSLQLELTNEPSARLQMTSKDDKWVCQVQLDRLTVNWRKRGEEYPRFKVALERFQEAWNAWRAFIAKRSGEALQSRQWELMYVNSLPKGNLWQSPADWSQIVPNLLGGQIGSQSGLQMHGFQGRWVWEAKNPSARVYAEVRPGWSTETPTGELMLINLIARGPVKVADTIEPSEVGQDFVESGIKYGHQLLIPMFEKVTATSAQQNWKKV